MRNLSLLALGVGVACVVLWLQVRAPSRDAGADLSRSRSPAPAAPAIAADAPARVPALPVRPAARPDADRPPTTDDERDELLGEQRDERARERERIRTAFEREARDAGWASGVEADVRASMTRTGDDATLVEVECRSSLCALVMTHPDVDRQTDSMNALAGAPGFRLAGRAHLEVDHGEPTTYVFLARDADRFPRL